MIFPWLRGLIHPVQAPLTYFLLFVNLFVFVATYEQFSWADKKLDKILTNDAFLETQGVAFATMIRESPQLFTSTLQKISTESIRGGAESRRLLGNLALRNSEFMARAQDYDFGGDQVALAIWKTAFLQFKALQDEHPVYLWGVSQSHNTWLQWMSYQFAHSGGHHLFWNMLFLVIFGCFVEAKLGSSFVVLAYIGGGLMGAAVFSLLSGISPSPLVGASAGVSGIMGLVAFVWFKGRQLKFFYWLLPTQGYYGFALLPGWIVLVVWILPDISGYLASSSEFASVAHTAHLGGTVFGAFMAWVFAKGWLVKEVEDAEDSDDSNDVGNSRRQPPENSSGDSSRDSKDDFFKAS